MANPPTRSNVPHGSWGSRGRHMKKYFIAAAVAVIAFSMAAFAAQLNVDAGVLQAGVDDNLKCADNANVSFDHHASGGEFWTTAVNIEFDNDCTGELMYLAITGVGAIAQPITSNSFSIPVVSGPTYYGNYGIPTEDIQDVNLTVYTSNPNNPGADNYKSGAFAPAP